MQSTLLKRFQHLSRYEQLAIAFSLIVLIALCVVGSFHKMGGYGVETDFYWAYAPDAQRILDGELPQEPGVGPGYPLVLAGIQLLFGDWFVSGKLLSILSSVLCGLFTFKFLQALFDARVAFFTLVLWHVTVLPWSITAGTDLFFAMLVSASLYFLYRNGRLTRANIVMSAVFMGLTYLTRHNAVVLPIGVFLLILFLNPESWSWRARGVNLAIFAGIFILVNLPWGMVQYFSGGSAVRSDSYLIIASHYYGQPGVVSSEDMRLAAKNFDSLQSVIFYDFGHFVKHYISNLYHHFYKVLIHSVRFPSFLFVGAGAVLLLPKLNRRQLSLFVFPALSFLLLCLVHYEPRYYLYILSFFLLFVAYFLFRDEPGSRAAPEDWLSVKLQNLAFAATVLLVLIFSAKEVRANIHAEPRELLAVAQGLQDKVEARTAIIARKPHLGFLTGMRTVYFPEATTLAALADYAEAKQASYLLYGQVEAERRPELRILLEPERAPAAFEPIYVRDNPRTVVYKIRI